VPLQPQAEPVGRPAQVHVIGCGALVRELRAALPTDSITVTYLPAPLHNRPERIVPAIEAVLDGAPEGERVFLAYGDCGTGGALDQAMDRWRSERRLRVSRLPGDHCYEFFTGSADFARLHERELGTLFLTDYLARHFDLLIWQGLGLDEHPELLPMYFGNYTRVVHLRQTSDPTAAAELDAMACSAATRLDLRYEPHFTGLAPFEAGVTIALRHISDGRLGHVHIDHELEPGVR
jgi:hypothetical protein